MINRLKKSKFGLLTILILVISLQKPKAQKVIEQLNFEIAENVSSTDNNINLKYALKGWKTINPKLIFLGQYGGLSSDSLLKSEIRFGKNFLALNRLHTLEQNGDSSKRNAYIFKQLKEPLKKGTKVSFSLDYYIPGFFTNVNVNCFGVAFINNIDTAFTNSVLDFKPDIAEDKMLKIATYSWTNLFGEVTLKSDCNWIIIGFFEPKVGFKSETVKMKDFPISVKYIDFSSLRLIIDNIKITALE